VLFVEVLIVPKDRLNNACGATFMNAAMVHSLFFFHWGNGSACSRNLFTEVVNDGRFLGCSRVDFRDGIDVN